MAGKKSGSSENNVPKGKEKIPSRTAKTPKGDKPVQAKKPEPLFHLIGRKRVAFIEAARALSEDLHLVYGDEMSITKFGRILVELRGQNDLQGMVYLEQKLLDMFLLYEKTKEEMIEEQNLFKTSYSTPSIQMTFPEKVEDIFNAEIQPGAAEFSAVSGPSFLDGVPASTTLP